MNKIVKKGSVISVNYTGKLTNGEKFDSSLDRNEPLKFGAGQGQMIKGFDAAVIGMKVGEKKTITIKPEEAYGIVDKSKIITVKSSDFDDFDNLKVGAVVQSGWSNGKVVEKSLDTARVDFNHELAGKTLVFEIEIVSIE